jgi:hypothetical protein
MLGKRVDGTDCEGSVVIRVRYDSTKKYNSSATYLITAIDLDHDIIHISYY